MTLIELQDILGETILKIVGSGPNDEAHKQLLQNAEYVAKLSKQMINNADVILRTDKLCNRTSRIDSIVGPDKHVQSNLS